MIMQTNEIEIQEIMSLDNRLVSVVVLDDFRIRLEYSDGAHYLLDFSGWLDSGVLVQLKDPEVFAQARIGPNGRCLEFPGAIDFCADSLRMDAELQKNTST
jgi:hypothetical protein